METTTWLVRGGIQLQGGNYNFTTKGLSVLFLVGYLRSFAVSGFQPAVMINACQNIVDLSCLCPCRLLVWYRVGSADGETRRLCVWSPLLQLPAQIWSVCSALSCPEVSLEVFCFIYWALSYCHIIILCVLIQFWCMTSENVISVWIITACYFKSERDNIYFS